MTTDLAALEKLREEFPPGTVGVLPKPYKKDSPRGKCDECGGYHGLPAVHLDFVGHAAVTDRFLNVDPEWSWEPFSLDEKGLPALDRDGNLWIRLTICGVTRIGVGTGPSMKERIGDALRNAGMRFGVALSLWTKDELESGYSESKAAPQESEPPQTTTTRRAPTPSATTGTEPTASPSQLNYLLSLERKLELTPADLLAICGTAIGHPITTIEELAVSEASLVIDQLKQYREPAAAEPRSTGLLPGEEPF